METAAIRPPKSPKAIKAVLAYPKRRKLTGDDLVAICNVVTKLKCTERNACILLEINPDQWEVWKCRNKHKESFATLLARAKESKLEGLISNIENIGNGIGVKQPDWRASAWIAERIAPDRFALAKDGQPPNTTLNLQVNVQAIMSQVLDKVRPGAGHAEARQIEGPKCDKP